MTVLLCECGGVISAGVTGDHVLAVESEYGSVSLSQIHTPKYEEDFATLYSGTTTSVVHWGVGGNSCMWSESGYPGFDYPMVIETSTNLDECLRAYIQTQWGQYEYKYVGNGNAIKAGDNLIDLITGDPLVNWGKLGENLIVWNNETGKYVRYDLCEGTKIAL